MALREQVDILMTQRVTAEGGWDDQINAFTKFVEMRLEEQRQMCANDLNNNSKEVWTAEDIEEICFNAGV